MMTQEEFMDVKGMRDSGMTYAEIAEKTGYHRTTIAKWLKQGGPPERWAPAAERAVLTDGWRRRIAELLEAQPLLLSTSVHDALVAEGFDGSYATVVREARRIRGPRFRAATAASVPIETAPGAEAQFDFCDVSADAAAWGWTGTLVCFGFILCWSRWRHWWFTTSEDREHTFEGLVRAIDAAGGVPRVGRTDRMGALGRSHGRRFSLHPPAVAFAAHHGMAIRACQPRDAKRKGKVERPFRQLREGFLAEQHLDPPASIGQLNDRAEAWLDRRVHAVAHRTTKIPPAERLTVERPLLLPLPPTRFDTAYREPRRVHPAIPLISWRGVRYSVPTRVLGQTVEVHQPIDSDVFTVRWAGQTIATHTQAPSGADDVWDPRASRRRGPRRAHRGDRPPPAPRPGTDA